MAKSKKGVEGFKSGWFKKLRTRLFQRAGVSGEVVMAEKGVQDFFQKALACLEEHKSDKPAEPFKSLYKASEHFSNALNNLKNRGDKSEAALLAQAQILYEMGQIEASTEEAGGGQRLLKEALDALPTSPDEVTVKRDILKLSILNQLAIIDSTRNQLEEALEKLKKAENLYTALTAKWSTPEALDAEEHHLEYLLGSKEKIPRLSKYSILIEEEGTKTKYYMAQCYQHLDDTERSAIYCHLTLKKQLRNREFLSFFDPVDWAVSAATLSQFFLYRDNFNLALHLLACSQHMLSETKAETTPEDMERLQWRSADVARCWIKYCVYLLEVSKDLKNKADDGKTVEYPPVQPLPAKMIEHGEVEEIEKRVNNNVVKTFEDARKVFLEGQAKVSEATSYYSLQDRASDYVLVAQDSSKLYRDLAAFEDQIDRKCKMHKRRIDLLEEMVKILNPKYYSGELQQLHFELAEVYTEMMELKYASLPKGMLKPTDGPVNKINLLTRKAIYHFKQFLNLIETFVVKDSAGADKIAKYEESYVRPALVATFSIGRLESKFIVGHPREQLENLEKGKKHFDYVDAYIKKYPEHAKFVEGELEVMRELMELLPQAIQNVISSTLH
ncbi:KIF1-binding protein homolog [Galendromus occidentalis]|uniref:KIF-binding protein n=1 Tax=Galendromus occidentalis TaxID=34638 RepID=A0AAJ6QRZ9_9ACAR|nr:KIF1-binding protein homolog [Galendromus occidentalis]